MLPFTKEAQQTNYTNLLHQNPFFSNLKCHTQNRVVQTSPEANPPCNQKTILKPNRGPSQWLCSHLPQESALRYWHSWGPRAMGQNGRGSPKHSTFVVGTSAKSSLSREFHVIMVDASSIHLRKSLKRMSTCSKIFQCLEQHGLHPVSTRKRPLYTFD